MAKSDQPFAGISDMMAQNFEQNRKTMDNYFDLFRKGMTVSPCLDSALNKKMKSYTEQNVAAAYEFAQKLTQAKDFQAFWQIQSEFMQAQWKAFSAQMMDLSETATKGATGALKDIPS